MIHSLNKKCSKEQYFQQYLQNESEGSNSFTFSNLIKILYLDLIQIEFLFLFFIEKLNRTIDAFFQDYQGFCPVNAVHFLDFVQNDS